MFVLVASVALLLLGGCGPTEMESGQAVLLMAPLITAIGALFASGYVHLWRSLADDLHFRWRPSLVVIVLQLIACVGIPFMPHLEVDWLGYALWFVGTSYLTLQFLVIRVSVIRRIRRYYSSLSITPWLVLYPPALYLAYLGSDQEELQVFPGMLWTAPGYAGLSTGFLLVVFLVEVALRRGRQAARLRKASLPAPLPQARVIK